MAAAIFDSPTTGTARSVQVPASAYFGLSASTAVTLFTAGAVPYIVYVPSSTALATFGWTGLPYRVLVYWATGSSNFTGTPATNVGQSATDNNVNIGAKLGYGTANDGHLASPIQTWPTLVVFVQGPITWSPAISGASARGWYMVHDAVMQDVFANYNCDRNFIYGCGASTGSTRLAEYVIGNSWWPTRFPIKYAAITTVAGAISGSGTRQDWPEAIQGETSTSQTFPRIARQMIRKVTVPWWDVHSTADSQAQPNQYNPLEDPIKQEWPNFGNPIPAGQSAGSLLYHGKYYRFQEFTGANAPDHSTPTCIFDYFYGNNAVGSPLASPGGPLLPTDPWATWMFQQKLTKTPRSSARNTVYSYAGGSGSGGGGVLQPVLPGDSGMMQRMTRRRRGRT